MNDELVGDAATELLDMRARRRVVPDLPFALRPETLSDAYAIQHRVDHGDGQAHGDGCADTDPHSAQRVRAALLDQERRDDQPIHCKAQLHRIEATTRSDSLAMQIALSRSGYRQEAKALPQAAGSCAQSDA